jgi:tetratricopeptide (TPR) repeat protein
LILLTAPTAASAQSVFWMEDSNLSEADALVQRMRTRGAAELPAEALAYFDAGQKAARDGRHDEAKTLFENAVVVDPAFPEAHLSLARLDLFHHPQSVPGHLWNAATAASRSFGTQHLVLINTLAGGFVLAVLVGMMILAYALMRLAARVHHVMSELMRPWLPAPVANLAAAIVFVAPFLWNLGLLPALLFLGGLVWPLMRSGERKWTVAVAGCTLAAPLVLWGISPLLFAPLDPESRPFLISRAMVSPYGDGLVSQVERAHADDPDNPHLDFALGMLYKRGGRLADAGAAYERALENRGTAGPIHNNLGVIAYHRGDYDRAIGHFQRAVRENSNLAAAHYNLSQAYAKKLYFEKADEELREANRLAFRRIRSMIKHQTGGVNGTLLDEPLPAWTYWSQAWTGPRQTPGVPGWLALFFPGSLVVLPIVGIPLLILGIAVGIALHRRLPSYPCTNCSKPISRRGLRRIRRRPYCIRCGDALLQIQSAAYSRLALDSRFRRANRLAQLAVQAFGWILPGYHAARCGRVQIAAALNAGLILSLLLLVKGAIPVTRLAWLSSGPGLWWPEFPLALFAVVQAFSWFTLWKLSPVSEEEPEEEDQIPYMSTETRPDKIRAAA